MAITDYHYFLLGFLTFLLQMEVKGRQHKGLMTCHGGVDKSLSEQQVYGAILITLLLEKNWANPPSASLSYYIQAGRQIKGIFLIIHLD